MNASACTGKRRPAKASERLRGLAVAFEETRDTPNPASVSEGPERPGVSTDDKLRRLLMDQGGVEIAASEANPSAARAGQTPSERMLSIRVTPKRYEVLAALAAEEGIPPTTLARLLLNRAIRKAEQNGPRL